MSRRVFDILTSTGGAVIVVVLLIAGGLLTWGHSYVNSNVHSQLAQQQIYFPPKAAFQHPDGKEITKSMTPTVSQYAGQQLLTGAQAKVWANDFMAVHLYNMPYHGVYAKISAAARANPSNKALAALEATSFQGTTLRGLLLEAYAFSTVGVIMFWGAIASFVTAFILAICVGLGFRHALRTPEEERMLARKPSPAPTGGPVPAS